MQPPLRKGTVSLAAKGALPGEGDQRIPPEWLLGRDFLRIGRRTKVAEVAASELVYSRQAWEKQKATPDDRTAV